MEENGFPNNCGNTTHILSIQELKVLNFSRCITAAVCALILILLLVILCCSKAYSTMTHRIFLYLIFATLAEEASFAANLILQPYFKINSTAEDLEGACTILGFFVHWSSMCYVFSVAGTIVHAIILMCIIIRYPQCLSTNNIPTCCTPRARELVVDIFYLSIVILVPLILACPPLIKGSYGLTNAWCWIQCDTDIFNQINYGYYIYEGLGILYFAALVILSITYCKLSSNNSLAKVLLFRILMMTMFVLFSIILMTIDVLFYLYYSRTHLTHLPYYAVVVVQAVGAPIGILVVPLGFLCSFYYQHFHRTCCTRATRRQYEKLDTGKATSPASERISQPSNTFFDIPYTNGFTSVTEW